MLFAKMRCFYASFLQSHEFDSHVLTVMARQSNRERMTETVGVMIESDRSSERVRMSGTEMESRSVLQLKQRQNSAPPAPLSETGNYGAAGPRDVTLYAPSSSAWRWARLDGGDGLVGAAARLDAPAKRGLRVKIFCLSGVCEVERLVLYHACSPLRSGVSHVSTSPRRESAVFAPRPGQP